MVNGGTSTPIGWLRPCQTPIPYWNKHTYIYLVFKLYVVYGMFSCSYHNTKIILTNLKLLVSFSLSFQNYLFNVDLPT